MRRLAPPAFMILFALAAFLALFPLATLDVGNAGWLIRGTDNGENALGVHAWLHDPAPQTSPRTSLLNAPDGVALLFTDSNPLVALAVKPFAALLPPDAQFVGPWILLSFILQAFFAWLLLRRHAPDGLALWCGVALLAFPPTLGNRFLHANLMAHWTILAALWLFLDPVRGRRLHWWALLIALTTLIHGYLLIMVGAIWASAMLRRVRGEPVAVAGHGALVLGLVGLLAAWLGVGGDHVPAGNYGAFAMPLDALWNPGNPSYSLFLPSTEQRPGRGFEGFQYLGLGGLLLLAAAIATAWWQPVALEERRIRQALVWFVPACIVLFLLAIGNRVDFAGVRMFYLPLPQTVIDALDAVRASGRMIWPVAYTVMLVAIVAVYRLPRDRAGLVLAALLIVQIADISGMASAIHTTSAEASARTLYVRTPDTRWDAVIAGARDIAFVPSDVTTDLSLFQEVAWRAAKAGRPVRSVYAARNSETTLRRLAREDEAFARGALVPDRLYIVLPGASLPAAAMPRRRTIDGVTVIAPGAMPAAGWRR